MLASLDSMLYASRTVVSPETAVLNSVTPAIESLVASFKNETALPSGIPAEIALYKACVASIKSTPIVWASSLISFCILPKPFSVWFGRSVATSVIFFSKSTKAETLLIANATAAAAAIAKPAFIAPPICFPICFVLSQTAVSPLLNGPPSMPSFAIIEKFAIRPRPLRRLPFASIQT